MKLTFCGAARIVTGSCYLIETGKTKFLVDCGMFQGSKEITRLNYEDFDFDPSEIDFVLLTHAHIDHSGLLPKLVSKGFSGAIYATPATIDLCKVMLEDAASTMLREVQDENKRRLRAGLPAREPLYGKDDVKATSRLFSRAQYDKQYTLPGGISFVMRDAGHIIGSAIIELFADGRKLVFSGDLGQIGNSIVRDPTIIEEADYVFIESTYGDRLHEDFEGRDDLLLKYAKETYKKGGKLMIPAFAVERTQELLYSLNRLASSRNFPNMPIFLDSPLAIKATSVFSKYPEYYDEEAAALKDPFGLKNVKFTPKTEDSIMLNDSTKPCIIIAGSGMCTGGRIRHHFKHGLWNPKNTVLFVGFQAEGTLGRYILEGSKLVKMMGMEIAVKADIRRIDGFSAHADYNGLLKWVKGFKKKPKVIFVVHGEPKASQALSEKLGAEEFTCKLPVMKQTVEL